MFVPETSFVKQILVPQIIFCSVNFGPENNIGLRKKMLVLKKCWYEFPGQTLWHLVLFPMKFWN